MNYNISFPGHCGCHNHHHGVYGTNMWNPNYTNPNNSQACGHQQACNGCPDIIRGPCLWYTGTNLTNTGINQNDNFNLIIQKLDALFAIQATKNTNILAALNDLNDRVNALELAVIPPIPGGGVHPDYTLL